MRLFGAHFTSSFPSLRAIQANANNLVNFKLVPAPPEVVLVTLNRNLSPTANFELGSLERSYGGARYSCKCCKIVN